MTRRSESLWQIEPSAQCQNRISKVVLLYVLGLRGEGIHYIVENKYRRTSGGPSPVHTSDLAEWISPVKPTTAGIGLYGHEVVECKDFKVLSSYVSTASSLWSIPILDPRLPVGFELSYSEWWVERRCCLLSVSIPETVVSSFVTSPCSETLNQQPPSAQLIHLDLMQCFGHLGCPPLVSDLIKDHPHLKQPKIGAAQGMGVRWFLATPTLNGKYHGFALHFGTSSPSPGTWRF